MVIKFPRKIDRRKSTSGLGWRESENLHWKIICYEFNKTALLQKQTYPVENQPDLSVTKHENSPVAVIVALMNL
jgi:hypothetical protein